MSISDLLWACPLCGRVGGVRDDDGGASCTGCGATFRRAQGAEIAARRPGGGEEARSAADWLADLPPLPGAVEVQETIGPDRAVVRIAHGQIPMRFQNRFIGWGERFGRRQHGRIRLTPDALVFLPDDGPPRTWPLDAVTAVQPTSTALQIKVRGEPVVHIRFLDASVRLWEHHLHERLRARFRAAGRGEIVEFQPRICTR